MVNHSEIQSITIDNGDSKIQVDATDGNKMLLITLSNKDDQKCTVAFDKTTLINLVEIITKFKMI